MPAAYTTAQIQTALQIADKWEAVAGILFFGSMLLAFIGGMRRWSFGITWFITMLGMVGAYIIFDFVIMDLLIDQFGHDIRNAIGRDYGETPGVPGALISSFFVGPMLHGFGWIVGHAARKIRSSLLPPSSPPAQTLLS